MNMELFRLINGLAYKNILLDNTMIFFSKYVPFLFIAAAIGMFALGVYKKDIKLRKAAVNTIVFTSINMLFGYVIGLVYYVNRPFVNNRVNMLFAHVKDASFPSDHALGTMSIALGLKKASNTTGFVLIGLSLVVGFSRVYVGHHYPADIIGAYIIVLITNYIYNAKVKIIIEKTYDLFEEKMLRILRLCKVKVKSV